MIIIDEMTLKDLEKIKDTLQTEYDEFWTYKILEGELKNSNSKYFVAYENEEIVGFAGVNCNFDMAELMNIVTKKTHRQKGIAKSLLRKIILYVEEQNYTKLCLEVNENNIPALTFYKNYGFHQVGHRPNYYPNNQSAILMDLELGYE